MDSPRRLGSDSVSCNRNRCQYSAARNQTDGRIRPCRMAVHKEKAGQVHWPLVSAPVVCQGYGTSVETYYCSLSNHTKCPVQLRITRSLTTVILETLGREHLQACCHAHDQSKKFNYKQRIAVAKVVKIDPKAMPTDVRRALHHLSPSGKIKAQNLRLVRSIPTLL